MKKMKFLWVPLGVALLLGSCMVQTVTVNSVRVEKIEAGQTLNDYFAYYALPRTVLDIEVVVEKTMLRPGPFQEHARRLLGIEDVITRARTAHRIKEVRLSQHAEKDPGEIYRVTTEGDPIGARLTLTPEGILAGVNLPWKPMGPEGPTTNVLLREDPFYFPEYPDLSLRKNIEEVSDTLFWKVRTDTSFKMIPLLESKVNQKTVIRQAEEAANVIMKLRKRRFYLLNGEYAYREEVRTPMPEGEALEIILRELAQMEYDYLSLFIGRIQTEETVYSYQYTPKGQGYTEAETLLAFSNQQGILPPEDTSGDPVRIQLNRTDDNPIDQVTWEEDPKKPAVAGLAHRVPEKMMVSLWQGGQKRLERELLIAQAGRIEFLPVDLVTDPKTAIEFYPAFGSIKSIYTK